MAQIFISFVHEEEKLAAAVHRFLQKQLPRRTDVFLSSDKWKIYAGELWLERIREELSEATIVILMLSKRSVGRPWVNFEAGAAMFTSKTIIPVCFGGLSVETLPKPYSSFQGLNLKDDPYYLVTSVCHHLMECLPPPPPPSLLEVRPSEDPLYEAEQAYRELFDALAPFEQSVEGE